MKDKTITISKRQLKKLIRKEVEKRTDLLSRNLQALHFNAKLMKSHLSLNTFSQSPETNRLRLQSYFRDLQEDNQPQTETK